MYRETLSTNECSCSDTKPHYLRKSLDCEYETFFLHLVFTTYENYDDPEDMCTALKRRLDDEFGPTWHVIVGDYFGRYALLSSRFRLNT